MNAKKKKSKENFDLNAIKHLKGIAKARAFLTQEPNLKLKFGFNTLTSQIVVMNSLPWRKCKNLAKGMPLEEEDTLLLQDYALEKYNNLILNEEAIRKSVEAMGYKNKFCPVQKYLLSLPKWDKVPRLSALLSEYLGAEDNPYTRETSQLFIIAAVKRIFEPACKFDHMLVLQGKQGLGKSSFLSILGGEWFSDSLRNFNDKTAIEQILGSWFVEIPELQGFNKADITDLKAFITRQQDLARLAYRRDAKPFPRKCILFGTTNNDEYLADPTENRRFSPIICTKRLDFEKLKSNRTQIFAEALYYYNEYKNLDPNDMFGNPFIHELNYQNPASIALWKQALKMAEFTDLWADRVMNWLLETRYLAPDYWERKPNDYNGKPYTKKEAQERKKVATLEIIEECLEPAKEKIGSNAHKRISAIMLKLGCQKGSYRFGKRYGKVNGYILPDDFYSKYDWRNEDEENSEAEEEEEDLEEVA